MNNTLFPTNSPSALDLCRNEINPSQGLDVACVTNPPVVITPGGHAELRGAYHRYTDLTQTLHSNTQNNPPHTSHVQYTQPTEKWGDKSDKTS